MKKTLIGLVFLGLAGCDGNSEVDGEVSFVGELDLERYYISCSPTLDVVDPRDNLVSVTAGRLIRFDNLDAELVVEDNTNIAVIYQVEDLLTNTFVVFNPAEQEWTCTENTRVVE